MSTIIVISSPFQALCAVEAINQLKINNYKLYIVARSSDSRLQNIINIFDYFHIEYDIVALNNHSLILNTIKCFLYSHDNFPTGIIGNVFDYDCLLFAISRIIRKGKIIAIDDGNSTYSLLTGCQRRIGFKCAIKYQCLRYASHYKRINYKKNIFTIFFDIKSSFYNIMPNKLTCLRVKETNNSNNCIVFVGTNTLAYLSEINISLQRYLCIIEITLKNIRQKYPNYKAIYIPHGRDNNQEIEKICEECSFEYKKLSTCIEFYLLKENIHPIYVVGFSSTALFTIKKIYADTIVENIVPNDLNSIEYENIKEYYEKNGIKTISI